MPDPVLGEHAVLEGDHIPTIGADEPFHLFYPVHRKELRVGETLVL
jgi:hypothetical protein